MTKGFIFGVLLTPGIIALMFFWVPRIMKEGPSKITGHVAIYDPTGMVTGKWNCCFRRFRPWN
jgi:hypothetical protein